MKEKRESLVSLVPLRRMNVRTFPSIIIIHKIIPPEMLGNLTSLWTPLQEASLLSKGNGMLLPGVYSLMSRETPGLILPQHSMKREGKVLRL